MADIDPRVEKLAAFNIRGSRYWSESAEQEAAQWFIERLEHAGLAVLDPDDPALANRISHALWDRHDLDGTTDKTRRVLAALLGESNG